MLEENNSMKGWYSEYMGTETFIRVFALLNFAVKLSLVGAIVFMFLNPDLPQFESKSLGLRAVLYPIFALAIAVGYYLRRMKGPYPHLADFLWCSTFTFDIVSNDAHLYGTYKNYDDFVHFVNAVPYMFLLVGLLISFERLGKIRLGYIGLAFFAFTLFLGYHAVWEMYEHAMDRFFGTNLQPGGMTEATDNNFFSLVGAVLALFILHFWRKTQSYEAYLISPMASYVRELFTGRSAVAKPEESKQA